MKPTGITTDWYTRYREHHRAPGTHKSDTPDGGTLAWGEQYLLRMDVNLYETFGETEWLDDLVVQVDAMQANLSDVPRFAPYDPRYIDGFRGWGQNRYSQYQPQYTEWFCDDGLIIGPILRFVELALTRPELRARYREPAERYLRTIEREVIAKWRARWEPDAGWTDKDPHRRGQNAGFHLYEWSGWRDQPLNMYLSFTDGMATLRRLAKLPEYVPHDPALPAFYDTETRAMLQYFHDQLEYQEASDAYVWKYGARSAWPKLMEDVGHAFVDLQAMLQGVQSGLSFKESDLRRTAHTFTAHVWNGSLETPEFRYYVDGTPNKLDADRGHWGWGFLYLCSYDFRIWQAMARYFEQHIDIRKQSPYIAVTAAMLAIGTQQHDRWAPAAPRDAQARTQGADMLLSWQPPLTDAEGTPLTGLRGYRVYRAPAAKGPYALLTETPLQQLWYRDAGTAQDRPHYRVTAIDYRRPPNESPPIDLALP